MELASHKTSEELCFFEIKTCQNKYLSITKNQTRCFNAMQSLMGIGEVGVGRGGICFFLSTTEKLPTCLFIGSKRLFKLYPQHLIFFADLCQGVL